MSARFIFVTGGVVSSLGKGVSVASIGALLQNKGFKVKLRKLDPYLNVDPGTLNPYEHGEVFITEDGGETDLDLGHYERFTGVATSKNDNTTSGKIYSSVIQAERKGEYLGKTVQVIPHITDAIKNFILHDTEEYDFVISEIGGTIGDIESLPFLEAIRQLKNDLGHDNVLNIHLTLLPYIESAGEMKTKPTQNSIKNLLSIGIQADFILCRTVKHITDDIRTKIAHFCNVSTNRIFEAVDTDLIYRIPVLFKNQNLDNEILKFFNVQEKCDNDLKELKTFISKYEHRSSTVNVGIFGKYIDLQDSYKSLHEALRNTGINLGIKVNIVSFNTEEFNKEQFENLDGVIIPGGFGARGVEGKIQAIKFARENDIPCLGICFGMQLMLIEFARNVLNFQNANSTELDAYTNYPVIHMLQMTRDASNIGGSMRLGNMVCNLTSGTKIAEIYKSDMVKERFRHRYGFNTKYTEDFKNAGMVFSAKDDNDVIEAVELSDKKWFVGVQYHPEFNSTPLKNSPLFESFIKEVAKI